MRKVLIIGASSNIGNILSEKLFERGYTLVGTYHKNYPKNPECYSQLIKINILSNKDLHLLMKYVRNANDIIFTVGKTEYLLEEKAKDINYISLKNLVDCMKNLRKKPKIIFCSSSAVFGNNENQFINEKSSKEPNNYYAYYKLESENLLINSGCSYIIVRFPMVFGKYFRSKSERIVESAKEGKVGIIGSGRNNIPFIHEDDLANAFLFIIENNKIKNEDFNFSSGSILQKEYWKKIFSIYNLGKTKKFSLKDITKIADNQLQQYNKLGIRPKIYKEYIQSMTRNREYDCRKAEKLLKWKPNHTSKGALEDNFNKKIQNNFSRKEGINILRYLFHKKTIPARVYENVNSFKRADFKGEEGDVWSVTIRGNGIINTEHLFSRDIDNIKKFMKNKVSPGKIFIVRLSPPSKDIIFYGSFLYDKTSFPDKIPITLSRKQDLDPALVTNKLGKSFKIFPRDFETSISMTFAKNKISHTNLSIPIKYVRELQRNIKKFYSYIKITGKEESVISVLFIINRKKGIQYLSLWSR